MLTLWTSVNRLEICHAERSFRFLKRRGVHRRAPTTLQATALWEPAMRVRPSIFFLFIAMSVASTAHSCSRAFAIDLDFAADSATLETSEVLKLVGWLDKWRKEFPRLESVRVDGIAPATAKEAKALAHHRAMETERVLRTLLDEVPIHVTSHLSLPSSTFKGGNYAAIDLVPFQIDLPDCSPVPIPGFKR